MAEGLDRTTLRTVLLLALLAALAGLWRAAPDWHRLLAARWTPWAPLQVDRPDGPFIALKLARLDRHEGECLWVLSETGGSYRPLPDRELEAGCALDNAVRVRALGARLRPTMLSCRAAVALALWERHELQPAARALLGAPVARIEHYGSYACRNLYGRPEGRRSRHATADALDVAGFVLADGRRIDVRGGWDGQAPHAAFLRRVRDGACRWFGAVLGPDYNAAHADHLHLERGGARLCR